MFDQVVRTFRATSDEKSIQLVIEPTDLKLVTDPVLLWEALSNLVQNSVRLSVADQRVHLRAEQVDGHLRISVRDEVNMDSASEGQAGFGLQIVRQVARLLEAEFCISLNLATLVFSSLKVEPATVKLD